MYFGMVLMEAEHRFGVQLLLCHHQLEHMLAIPTHDQLERVLVFFKRHP